MTQSHDTLLAGGDALPLSHGVVDDGPGGCMSVFPLRGDRVLLRPLTIEHLPAMVPLANNPAVSGKTAVIPYPYSNQDGAEFIQHVTQDHARGLGLTLAIETTGEQSFVGVVGLMPTEDGPKTAELGYWLGQAHWGQGLATDAVRHVLAHAFDTLALDRLVAYVAPDHPASATLLEKVGFTADGQIQRAFPARGDERLCTRWVMDRAAFAKSRESRLLLVTAVALLDSDNRVLLQQRPLDKHMGGLWEFPGGKVDPGETPERALVRELQEELGIDVRESCLAPLSFASHAYDGFHLLMPLYICRTWKGQVSGKEGQKLAWVRGADLTSYPMPPADIPLIPMLREWL